MKKVEKEKIKLSRYTYTAVAVVYFVSLLILFWGFDSQESRLFDSRTDLILNIDENSTAENFIPDNFAPNPDYPIAVALYNSKGELVHTNGTIISFYDGEARRYCYIDEFLSAEEINRVREFLDEEDIIRFNCESIAYYESADGRIIPTALEFSRTYSMDKSSDVSTETEIFLELEKSDKTSKKIAEDGNIQIFSCGIPRSHSDSEVRLFNKLIDKVTGEEDKAWAYNNFLNDEVRHDTEKRIGGGGTFSNHSYACNYQFNLQGEGYFAVVRSQYNPISVVVKDGTFVYLNILLLNICIIVAKVIRHYIFAYYDKTKKFEENKTAFTSAAAHELKTPIAIIQNQCECIMENVAPEKNGEYINSIYEETQKMSKLVSDLLQYNRLAQAENIPLEDYDIGILVQSVVDEYKNLFELHSKNVTVELEDTPTVKCNPELISLVIGNFLSNTVKHSPDGGDVRIKLQKVGEKSVKVTVFNTGDHIPDEIGSSVWNILYKGDSSRTDRTDSGGIGLAISARILDLHGAYYDYKNVKDGVTFCFII